MRQVAVLGAGSWGTSLSITFGKNNVEVRLWDHDAVTIENIKKDRENKRYLPGFAFPDTVHPMFSLEEAIHGVEAIVVAVPSQVMRLLLCRVAESKQIKDWLSGADKGPIPVWAMVGKGLESDTGMRMSEIAHEVLGKVVDSGLVVVSGPNLAVEVARGVPTATVAASDNKEAATTIQSLLMCPTLRVYVNSDVTGVELGGALKNVLAIAAGISDALGYGDNTKGAILARGLAEMTRIGAVVGAKKDTFLGLTGVGDLFATAASKLSRNYRVGFGLGQGKNLNAILEELGQVAEGVPTAKAALVLAKKYNIEMPLISTISAIIDGELTPFDGVGALMMRAPKEEM